MNKRSKLGALLGAGLLTFAVAGIALADGTENWTGQGVTDGQLNSVDCESSQGAAYIYWVFSLGGGDQTVTDATLHLSGSGSGDYPMTIGNGNEAKVTTPFFDLGTLNANATYTGDLGS